jgi:hypothetical protein
MCMRMSECLLHVLFTAQSSERNNGLFIFVSFSFLFDFCCYVNTGYQAITIRCPFYFDEGKKRQIKKNEANRSQPFLRPTIVPGARFITIMHALDEPLDRNVSLFHVDKQRHSHLTGTLATYTYIRNAQLLGSFSFFLLFFCACANKHTRSFKHIKHIKMDKLTERS